MPAYPLAVEGSEDGGNGRAASGRERGHPRLHQLLMHLVSHAPLRETNRPAARARASMAVSSGSGVVVATTPEGGSPTAPSSSEDMNPSPDAAINILSTDGAPNEMLGAQWDGPAKSPGNRTGCSLCED